MTTYHFAIDTERTYFEVEAATEEEARVLLEADQDEYRVGCHHDYEIEEAELIDVETDD